MPETAPPAGLSDNSVAAIAYVTPIPAIAFLVMEPYKRSAYVRFHAWQSIFLFLAMFLVSTLVRALLEIFFTPLLVAAVDYLVWLAWVLLCLACAINAINGKRLSMPIIGALADRQVGAS